VLPYPQPSLLLYNLLKLSAMAAARIELLRQLERLATDQDGMARGRPSVLPMAAARCSPTKATWSCPATPPPRAPPPQAPPHTPAPASHALACPAVERYAHGGVCDFFPGERIRYDREERDKVTEP